MTKSLASCQGKFAYETIQVASQVARAQGRRKESRVAAYKCPVCCHYHVGETGRKKGRKK